MTHSLKALNCAFFVFTMRNLLARKIQIEDSFLGNPDPDKALLKEARMIQGVFDAFFEEHGQSCIDYYGFSDEL